MTATTSNILERLVQRAGQLFSLPTVALEVLELTGRPNVDARQLKNCIENDPALTARLLRVVNSSLFGLSQPVSNLNQALALLGVKPLKMLVLGFSLPSNLFAGVSRDVLSRYWRRALTKAVAAREISETVWQASGDEAFIAGLLQDLGVLVLIQEVGEPYVDFLRRVTVDQGDLAALERATLGFDHRELTSLVLSEWGLPASLLKAVRAPHDEHVLEEYPPAERSLCQVVQLAELTAQLLADESHGVLEELVLLVERYRNGTTAQIEQVIDHTEEKVDQLAQVMSVDLADRVNFQHVIERAHQQLVHVTVDVAAEIVRARHEVLAARSEGLLLQDELRLLAAAVAEWEGPKRRTDSAIGGVLRPERGKPAPARNAGPNPSRAPDRMSKSRGGSASCGMNDTDLEATLETRLSRLLSACRQARFGMSLLLVEIDCFDELAAQQGREAAERLARDVEAAARSLDHQPTVVLRNAASGFPILLANCERLQATHLGNQLVRAVRELGGGGSTPAPVSVSIGAASVGIVPKNFAAQDLIEAADRCLYAARSSGGNTLKSIEIC